MPASDQLKALIDQMPPADERHMYTQGIDKDKIDKATEEIYKGGLDNVRGVIDMLVEPGKGNDVKPHYALHCLAIYVAGLADEAKRQEFAQVLASELPKRPKGVQAYLCQELQACGGKEAVEALGKLLADEVVSAPAAMALVAIREGAGEQLRAALPKASGRCRLNIAQSLGVLADEPAVEALKQAAGDGDREVRVAAAWGLANIGDPGSVDVLVKASDAPQGWERIQNTKACLVLGEKLVAAGKKDDAAKLYTHLRDTRTDPSEKYVRDLAEKALAAAQ